MYGFFRLRQLKNDYFFMYSIFREPTLFNTFSLPLMTKG